MNVSIIENTVVKYFDQLFGDYGYVWLIVIGINILLVIHIIAKKLKSQTKVRLVMTILAMPFYNITYIWKNEKIK
ncbi:hypothetical protein GCM10008083_34300 [Ulvibacter litoralis]|nr:hypothetical protein GCM10008083_34300 [Ulvibacter litoralis]